MCLLIKTAQNYNIFFNSANYSLQKAIFFPIYVDFNAKSNIFYTLLR